MKLKAIRWLTSSLRRNLSHGHCAGIGVGMIGTSVGGAMGGGIGGAVMGKGIGISVGAGMGAKVGGITGVGVG